MDVDALVKTGLGALRVGPSVWGTVYRDPRGSRCYRLIPKSPDVTPERLDDLGKPLSCAPGCPVVPVEETNWLALGTEWFYVVSYRLPKAASALSEILAEAGPVERSRAVAAAFRTLPVWWQAVGRGTCPTPNDIVFVDGHPHLLRLPPWGPPRVADLLTDVRRAIYLAPELLRGASEVWHTAADLFALGVAALECFVTLPMERPPAMLHRLACAAAFLPEHTPSRLPTWMQAVPAIVDAAAVGKELTRSSGLARATADPDALALRLETGAEWMDPVVAVRRLRNQRLPGPAWDLAQAALAEDPSYDLLLLAAQLAWRDEKDPLNALSLLERAVAVEPSRGEGYADQFRLITELRTDILALLMQAIDPSFADRLDRTMRTAFDRLPASEQHARAVEMAWYLIDRRLLHEASAFVHGRLHSDGKLIWWSFDLMLIYAEVFLRLHEYDSAAAQLAAIKLGLRKVSRNRSVSPAEIDRHAKHLMELEIRLNERRG